MNSSRIMSHIFSKKVILPLFIALVLFVGLTTDLKYSDEIFHFWFAKDWYEDGSRPVYNKLVDTMEEFNYYRYYINAPLWHYLLQNLFRISPEHPKVIAQVYQVGFYALLILGTFLLAREFYGKEVAWYAALITASLPLFIAFSVILFIDVPIAALSPLLLLFLLRRNYILVGLFIGLMFLTKRNAYLLAPSIVILVLLNNFEFKVHYSYKKVLKALALIFLIVITLNISDLFFRYDKFGGLLKEGDKGNIFKHLKLQKSYKELEILGRSVSKVSSIYLNESITRPKNMIKFLGIALLLVLIVYLVKLRTLFQKQDLILIIPIILYIMFFYVVFTNYYAVRYLAPIIPLLIILGAKGITTIKRKPYRSLIVILCLLQGVAALSFLYMQRQINEDERIILEYVQNQKDENSRILTPDELFVSYYTGKPAVWVNSFLHYQDKRFYKILWGEEFDEKLNILEEHKIRLVYIRKDRVYNDSDILHFNGFPQSFVQGLPAYAQIEYDNNEVTLWRIRDHELGKIKTSD